MELLKLLLYFTYVMKNIRNWEGKKKYKINLYKQYM